MPDDELTIGIVAPSPETRAALKSQVAAAGIAAEIEESEHYCLGRGDTATRRLVNANPALILVDLEDPDSGLQTLRVFQSTLPNAWLFVLADPNNPQLLIESMRAGARDAIPTPIGPRSLAQALTRFVNERVRPEARKEPGNIYCVTSAKGGSGATTVAINLAASLGQIHKRQVLFIDLNYPVGDAPAYLNLRPEFTLSDALDAGPRLDAVLLESYLTRVDKFAVLAGFKDYAPTYRVEAKSLSRLLEVASQSFQDVIVDLPSWLEAQTLHTVSDVARLVLLVLTPELPALWRTERLLRFLEKNGGREKLRVIVNRATKRDDITEKEITKVLEQEIFWRLPNNYGTSIESINAGKPLVTVNHSELARGYRELAEEIAGLKNVNKRGGVLSFLFK